jgi:hypothetical protein
MPKDWDKQGNLRQMALAAEIGVQGGQPECQIIGITRSLVKWGWPISPPITCQLIGVIYGRRTLSSGLLSQTNK